MICPKCGAEQGEEKLECMRCGVIFAKLTLEDFDQASAEIEIKASDSIQNATADEAWTHPAPINRPT